MPPTDGCQASASNRTDCRAGWVRSAHLARHGLAAPEAVRATVSRPCRDRWRIALVLDASLAISATTSPVGVSVAVLMLRFHEGACGDVSLALLPVARLISAGRKPPNAAGVTPAGTRPKFVLRACSAHDKVGRITQEQGLPL
jgi:hypothetical protein